MSAVRLSKGLSADNIIVTPTHGPSRAKNRKRNASPSPTPKARPTTRADIEGTKAVDYDMKHHPMDDTMRPNAAAKRAAVTSSTPSMNGKGSNKSSVSIGRRSSTANLRTTTSRSTRRKTSAKQEVSTLLDKPLENRWLDLAPFDRRIFRLQAGAPASGKTLPFKWHQLADQLDQEGVLTKAQLKACGGVKALIERYELVRLHVQELFGAADEATDRTDFNISHAEGFDVYDLVGSKAEYVHVKDRDTAAGHSAKKTKFGHREGGGADVQIDSGIAEDTDETVTPTAEHMLLRSESEESEEISWEEQIWGPGGIRPEEMDENGDYVERMEQSREDVSALIDDVLMSQDHISEVYEEDMSQMQPTDIILSDCATNSDGHSTSIAERGTQKSASADLIDSTVGPNLSKSAGPVANMTANMPDPATGLQGEQVFMSVWQEKLKKVLEHGQLLPVQMAPKEEVPNPTGTPPSVVMAASDQLAKDLEIQASQEPEPVSHTSTQQIRVKPDVTSFQIFEDRAGSTPVVKKSIILQPLSPGTDVAKENFEDDSDTDDDSSRPTTSVGEVQLELPARSQIATSLFGPFAQAAIDDGLATAATSQAQHSSSLRVATSESITSTSGDGSHVSSGERPGGQD